MPQDETLTEFVWDQMARPRDLKIETVAADAAAVTFRVSFDIAIDRAHYRVLTDLAKRYGHRVTNHLKRIVSLGFKVCFSPDKDEAAIAA